MHRVRNHRGPVHRRSQSFELGATACTLDMSHVYYAARKNPGHEWTRRGSGRYMRVYALCGVDVGWCRLVAVVVRKAADAINRSRPGVRSAASIYMWRDSGKCCRGAVGSPPHRCCLYCIRHDNSVWRPRRCGVAVHHRAHTLHARACASFAINFSRVIFRCIRVDIHTHTHQPLPTHMRALLLLFLRVLFDTHVSRGARRLCSLSPSSRAGTNIGGCAEMGGNGKRGCL